MMSDVVAAATSASRVSPNLRASSYTIYVDLPDDPQHMLLLHGYTGAYDRVSRSVAAFVRTRETAKPPKPLHGNWLPEEIDSTKAEAPSDETIALLSKHGFLTTMNREEEEQLFVRMVDLIHRKEQLGSVHYVLMPTYDCNLRCAYCFQDHMRTDASYSHLLRTISKPMVDRIFAAMPAIEERHPVFAADPEAERYFCFFGGEPFLRRNKPAIEYVMAKIRALPKRTNVTAVSNGTDLDAFEELLGPEGIVAIQITIDGPRERHDQRRIYAGGSGSFDAIMANVDMALARGVNINVRMNIDRSNIGDVPELSRVFIDRGWTSDPNFVAYLAPIHGSADGAAKAETFNSWELSRELVALQEVYPETKVFRGPDGHLKTRARSVIGGTQDPFKLFRTAFCTAQTTMYVIDAFGDMYACWERTGDKNFRIGTITEEGPVFNDAQVRLWRSRSVASNPVCRQCRFALNCGGGCAVLAEGVSGDLHSNYCDVYGKRFRNAVAEAYGDHVARVELEPSAGRLCEA